MAVLRVRHAPPSTLTLRVRITLARLRWWLAWQVARITRRYDWLTVTEIDFMHLKPGDLLILGNGKTLRFLGGRRRTCYSHGHDYHIAIRRDLDERDHPTQRPLLGSRGSWWKLDRPRRPGPDA